jgi:SNF family Na+-dependent transporter
VDSIPKTLELLGLGFLWIRALGVNTGIPYVYPILLPCLLILAIVVLFLPNDLVNFQNFMRELESNFRFG